MHIKWDSARGVFEWYLDDFDIPYYSNLNIPTRQTNYRLHAPWNSTIYLGSVLVSSTRSSVLNAF